MIIAIGSDHIGFDLKEEIKKYLADLKIEFRDFGTFSHDPVDYPDVALPVAEAIAHGDFNRGILICGTGIGMSICANKVPGVRAALCHDVYSGERARKSNDAQIITMGSLVIGVEAAKKILEAWLNSEFQGGRSIPKVTKMNKIDEKYRKPI